MIVVLTFIVNVISILNVMEKVFKNSCLYQFLIVVGLLVPSFTFLNSSTVFSKSYKDYNQKIPIKRPSNFLNLEESADTILNMIQKVGGKPTINAKSTTLKKNETLSVCWKRSLF